MQVRFGPLAMSISSKRSKSNLKSANQTQSRFNLVFNYYPSFLENMLSNCTEYEIMYKYMILYRKSSEMKDFFQTEFNKKRFIELYSFDSKISLSVDKNFLYEFMVFIQTTFDSGPFLIGDYILDPNTTNVTQYFTDNLFKSIPISNNVQLFAPRWSYYVGRNSFMVSFFVQNGVDFDPEKIFCVLVDIRKQSYLFFFLIYKNKILNFWAITETGNKSIVPIDELKHFEVEAANRNYSQRLFKLENLESNSYYNLRVGSFLKFIALS
jgi:hypothetical protein